MPSTNSTNTNGFKYTFYANIKRINQDMGPMCISWQSFLADVKSEFSLSALPKVFKDQIHRKYELSRMKSLNDEASELDQETDVFSESGGIDPLNYSAKSLSLTQRNKQIAGSNNSKKSSNQTKSSHHHHHHHQQQQQSNLVEKSSSETNVFDWDDYFDANHRISTNQNIRMTNQMKENVSYAPRNISKNFALSASNSGQNLSGSEGQEALWSSLSKKKRFEDRLNSYKDNRYQASFTSDKSKSGQGAVGAVAASNSGTNLINQDICILTNLNNFNNNVPNQINSSFINQPYGSKKANADSPNYLIWDNNVSL